MRRAALAAPIAGVLAGGFGGAATLVPAAQLCAAATYTGHVTLVVEHGDTRVVGLCIGFDGSSITGEQMLQASGLEYATQSYGGLGDAVCQLDSEPASYGACLPASGSYWAMFVSRNGGGWQTADRGISTETFSDGDAEGFRYVPQSRPQPPPASPAGICARALAGPPTPAPAATTSATAAAGVAPAQSSAGGGTTGSGPDGGTTPPPAPTDAAAATPPPAALRAGGSGGVATVGTRPAPPAGGPTAALLAAGVAVGALAALLVWRVARRRMGQP
ncbi:MAG: hypothetical protein JOZ75_14170 [Candidatus Dormibacteraeota bacterium]|nr:hypothetical protein [Candidatus Dormibacteraeota bacterium]